jgi:4-oxalocrotonate tautomerase
MARCVYRGSGHGDLVSARALLWLDLQRAPCRTTDAQHRRRARPQEVHLPLVNVKVIEGVFSERLTEAMVAIEGENMCQVTWVIVEEVRGGDWAIGGTALITADVVLSIRSPLSHCSARS